MTSSPSTVPRLTHEQVARLAREHFGLAGTLEPLPSYDDQNFRLTEPNGARWVVKLANGGASEALLRAQLDVIIFLDGCAGAVPRIRSTRAGRRTTTVESATGQRHLLYVLSYLPGRTLGAGRHGPALLESVGKLVGEIGSRLEGYRDPLLRRNHVWDMRHAGKALDETHRIAPTRRRILAERYLERFVDHVVPRLCHLPKAVIHGDANEQNIVVAERDGVLVASGLIDFGDLAESCRVFDPTIAAAYACLGHDRPLDAIASVIKGHHAIQPLGGDELEVLFPSLLARLAVSVTMSIKSREERPDNTYANVSEAPGWEAMERLAGVSDALARDHLARACGRCSSARS